MGCRTRRSTRTTIVLSALSLTTVPCSTRFGILAPRSPGDRALLLAEHSHDSGDVAAHLTDTPGVFQLPRRFLEAQIELLLPQLEKPVAQLVTGLAAEILGVHAAASSCTRATNRVRIGSFAAPSRIASAASS